MGRAAKERPARLAEKISKIRKVLLNNITQEEMIRFLGYTTDELSQSELSAIERGTKLPSLLLLLRIARKTKISLEILIDDTLELPKTHKQ